MMPAGTRRVSRLGNRQRVVRQPVPVVQQVDHQQLVEGILQGIDRQPAGERGDGDDRPELIALPVDRRGGAEFRHEDDADQPRHDA